MKFSHVALAVLSFVIFCKNVQAQNIYLTAYRSPEIFTEATNPYELSNVHDSRSGSRAPVMANYAPISSMGLDTEQDIATSPSGPAGRGVTFKPLTITKNADLSSSRFFLAQCMGQAMTLEIITLATDWNQRRNVSHKLIMRNALVKTITTDAGSDCNCRQETITFEYETLEIYPYKIDNQGRISPITAVGWNALTQKNVNP